MYNCFYNCNRNRYSGKCACIIYQFICNIFTVEVVISIVHEFKQIVFVRHELHLARDVVMEMVVVIVGDYLNRDKLIVVVFIHGYFSWQIDESNRLKYVRSIYMYVHGNHIKQHKGFTGFSFGSADKAYYRYIDKQIVGHETY